METIIDGEALMPATESTAIRSVKVNASSTGIVACMGGIKIGGLGRERDEEGLRAFQLFSTPNIGG
ncbi:MAG: hypothetical protein WCE20_09710 [Rhizomicrobium sp.]